MVYVGSNELTHYGILGMKWGIRRYQNPDGSLTEEGKKRYGTAENLEAGTSKKQAEKREKEKKTVVESGNTKLVQKYSKELSEEDLTKAISRIEIEQRLSQLRNNDIELGRAKLNSLAQTVGNIRSTSEDLVKIYNVVAKTLNTFNHDSNMPVIGLNPDKKKKEDK